MSHTLMANVDSKTSQKALDMVLAAIGLREADHKGSVTITGKDPVLASRHRFGELMAAQPRQRWAWPWASSGSCAGASLKM